MNEIVENNKTNISINKEILVNEIQDNLKKEILDNELIELQDVYNKLKNHVFSELESNNNNNQTPSNNPRLGMRNNSPTKKATMYLASQTSNLISLKNLKLQFLKEQTRISESKIDRQLKLLQLMKDENKENGNDITAKDVLNYLINEIRAPIPITGESIDVADSIENELFDSELDKRLSEENIEPIIESTLDKMEFSSNEDGLIFDKYNIDGDEYKFIYKKSEDKFYLVDNQGNIIQEVLENELSLSLDDTDEDNEFIKENISNTIIEEIE
jgi:hypothetical protein